MINSKHDDFNITTIQYIPAALEKHLKAETVDSIENAPYDETRTIDYDDIASKAKVLVVSDEVINAEMVGAFLSEYGYQDIHYVYDISEIFEVVFHEQPDVILYETNTISQNAFNALQRIHDNIRTSLIPLLVLCAEVDEDTKLQALGLGVVDVIEKPASEKELSLKLRNILSIKAHHDFLVRYDGVTNLPNLNTFISKLEWSLKNAKRHQLTFALLQIHISGLGKVNDAYGMALTDQLVKAVSTRIKAALRDSDIVTEVDDYQDMELTVSRVSGNEFSILLPSINRAEDAAIVVKRLHQKIKHVYELEDRQIYVGCKTGIAIYPEDGKTYQAIMRAATLALRQAKTDAEDNYLFHSKELNALSKHRMELESDLCTALQKNELEVYFQPKVSIKTKKIIGAEALLRWNHSIKGFISPAEFIPLAEQTGHINQLGNWVIDAVTTQMSQWQADGVDVPRIAINVSSQQFNDERLAANIESHLKNKGLLGKHLTIELTETAVMENMQQTIETVNQLKQLGAKISIDDFGTGYSSLVQLKDLPLDEVKIDRTFTKGIGIDHNVETIVTAIIAMGRNLNLNIVAEGVETAEQLAFLDKHHCDEYQGYLTSPALCAKEFCQLLS